MVSIVGNRYGSPTSNLNEAVFFSDRANILRKVMYLLFPYCYGGIVEWTELGMATSLEENFSIHTC